MFISRVAAATLVVTSCYAADIFPAGIGTTWKYTMTQELGTGVQPADEGLKRDPDGKIRVPLTIFAAAGEPIDGKATVRFERHRAGAVQLTDFYVIKSDVAFLVGQSPATGEIYKCAPPVPQLKFPVKVGEVWDYNGKIGDAPAEQHFAVLGEEEVEVPAGKFKAFDVRISQTGLPNVVEDRWFVPEIGFVKIVTAMTQPRTERLIQRLTLELLELPKKAERPALNASATPVMPRQLHGALQAKADGQPTMTFKAETKTIFARWQGAALKKGDVIRCVLESDNAGRVTKIAEQQATAKEATDGGTFTFAAPQAWAKGDYRAEFFVGKESADVMRFTVGK